MPHNEHLDVMATALRALGSPIRLEMIRVLSKQERYCGDIVKLFSLSQSTVSHHLKTLKDAGLLLAEERGTATCYRVNRPRLAELKEQFVNL